MITLEEITKILEVLKNSNIDLTISCEDGGTYSVKFMRDDYGSEYDFYQVPYDFESVMNFIKAVVLINSYK